MDELEFRRHLEPAMERLKTALIRAEEDAGMEVEDQAGVLSVAFDDPPAKFVITPNSAARQIWISALVSSFKLDWSASEQDFVLARTGENLRQLVARLVNEQLGGGAAVTLQ